MDNVTHQLLDEILKDIEASTDRSLSLIRECQQTADDILKDGEAYKASRGALLSPAPGKPDREI